jgi:molybdate transport system substrate-binding protein
MRADHLAAGKDWTVGLRIWVERSGRAVLGQGRLQLLEAIDRCHSISAAARQMGMSYRRAWLLVQSINEAAGQSLVITATGGNHGGGALLTPEGRCAVAVFREIQRQLRESADSLLPRFAQSAGTASMHIAAAVSLEEALGQLLADFALQQPAVRIRAIFGASDELADHLLAGGPGDLFLTADTRQLDRLEAARVVQPGTRTHLVKNTLAAIGPTGATLTVRKPRDLIRIGVARIALAEPASPLGNYTRAFLENLGLYRILLPRAVQVDNSRAVVATIRARRADVGLVYGSDAVPAYGCRLLFRVRRTSTPIKYTAALVCRGQQPDQARTFLDFLTSPTAAGRFRQCGFLPILGHRSARQT